MPNFKKHALVGGGIGLAIAVVSNLLKQAKYKQEDDNYKFDWADLVAKSILGTAVGTVCGILPDVLEPATSSSHRKFFHSLSAAGIISGVLGKVNAGDLSKEEKEMINIAGASYLSHLILDSSTPMGLPLVA